jgi:hypothetical protein
MALAHLDQGWRRSSTAPNAERLSGAYPAADFAAALVKSPWLSLGRLGAARCNKDSRRSSPGRGNRCREWEVGPCRRRGQAVRRSISRCTQDNLRRVSHWDSHCRKQRVSSCRRQEAPRAQAVRRSISRCNRDNLRPGNHWDSHCQEQRVSPCHRQAVPRAQAVRRSISRRHSSSRGIHRRHHRPCGRHRHRPQRQGWRLDRTTNN